MKSLALALVLACILAPGATAYRLDFAPDPESQQYAVTPDVLAVPSVPGNPVAAWLTLLHDGTPVASARISLDGQTQFTNRDGQARYSFYEHQAAPHLMTVQVDSVEVLADGHFVPVEGDWPSLAVLWSDIQVRLSAPGRAAPGAEVPVTVEAFWQRTGHPIQGLAVTVFSDGLESLLVTGTDASELVLMAPESGSLHLTAGVAPEHRPNGIPVHPVVLEVQVAEADDATSPAGTNDGEGESEAGPGDSTGTTTDGEASPATNATATRFAESGPRPVPVTNTTELSRPLFPDPPAAQSGGLDPAQDAPGPALAVLITALALTVLRRRNP